MHEKLKDQHPGRDSATIYQAGCSLAVAPRPNRFYEAIKRCGHNVFVNEEGVAPAKVEDRQFVDASISDGLLRALDESSSEVGFPAGTMSGTTVLEVTGDGPSVWFTWFSLDLTPRIWTPHARYYLLQHTEPPEHWLTVWEMSGVRVLKEAEAVPYPGNVMSGQLIHWEVAPWEAGLCILPKKFWDVPVTEEDLEMIGVLKAAAEKRLGGA